MKKLLERLDKYVIVTNKEGEVYYCNHKLLNQLHRELNQIKGENIKNLLDETWLDTEEISEFYTYLLTNQNKKQYVQVERVEEIWEGDSVYYFLIEDGQTKRMVSLLENNLNNEIETELNHFLDTAIDLTAIINQEGILVKVDKRWQAKLGWTPEELLGQPVERFIHKEDRKRLKNLYNLGQGIRKVSNQILCKTGEYRWFEWQVRYLESDKIAICTARDITEEKLCEQEREAYKHKIEMDKIRNEFFRNMSHEFRTPINIILSGVQLIEKISSQEMISKEQLEGYLNKLKRNAFRLLKLANNLIDLTGMSVGSETLNLENHNIINIIEETTLSAVQYAKSKEITLIFDTEEEEVIMACDAEKIQCIVLNLLSNAIKYTPQKGQIEVNILRREDTIDLSVSDTGIGIPKEKREIIFEGGVQLDTSLRRISEGSGMGLAIVKGIVELCQGTVHVDSIEGEGTTFTVTLPIHILEDSESINEVESILKVERCNMEFSDLLVI